jgi:hypothetical protein
MKPHNLRVLSAKLFFSIFFLKMVISALPLITNHFDKDALLQVVLQLEIESNQGKSSTGQDVVKDVFPSFDLKDFNQPLLVPPLRFMNDICFLIDEEYHLSGYYPSVPTPPPNRLS